MGMQFTESQQAAITTSGKNILVSASAGSGKTRVLVERVLQKLLAGESINHFLIVTFTNAAAAEMKERLEKAIRGKIADVSGEERQHLLKQLRLLPVANISTLHAFALKLIEQYHYAIELDPQFRLIDDAEGLLVRQAVYDQVIEAQYAQTGAAKERFEYLVAQFKSPSQDDSPLQDAVMTLFHFAMARPDAVAWLDGLAANYESDIDFKQLPAYKEDLRPTLLDALDDLADEAERAVVQAPEHEGVPAAEASYENLALEARELRRLYQILAADELEWDQMQAAFLAFEFGKWNKNPETGKSPRYKKEEDDEIKAAWERVKAPRDERKERYQSLITTYFGLDTEGHQIVMDGVKIVMEDLVALTKTFKDAFLTEKLSQHMLDFNDLEHFALAIVQHPQVQPELKAHYHEVMVDEYQDTNQLQETILGHITSGDNLFQVGDIKQSIYKFRQADPTLFGSKLKAYPADPMSQVISLQENFRSQPNVTAFINYIFTQIMSESLGDVDYVGEAELVAGATYYPEDIAKSAELLVYLSDDPEDAPEPVAYPKTEGQIRVMAQRIQEIMADPNYQIFDRGLEKKRRLNYRDITILVPTKTNNLAIMDVFKELEIPLVVEGAENFFKTTEIMVMLSLLKVIDNPHQDIPLAAVLRSPMYQINENGLALIRVLQAEGDFYDAVRYFATASPEALQVIPVPVEDALKLQKTIVKFLADLAHFHDLAVQNHIVDLIWTIYNTTGWLDYVGGLPSGAQRQANLHALYQRAQAYQSSSFTGLYRFVKYVHELQKQDKDLSSADANLAEDSIRLMTIHKSKGLEFPVVFLFNATGDMISGNETRGDLMVDPKAGAGLDYVDVAHHIKFPTMQRRLVKEAKLKGAFAEQLRVLYVALTRAEQNLFMVGDYADADKAWDKWKPAQFDNDEAGMMLREGTRRKSSSFMDLMGMALGRHPEFKAKMQGYDYDVDGLSNKLRAPKVPFEFAIKMWDTPTLDSRRAAMGERITEMTTPELPKVDATQDWGQVLDYRYGYEPATRATAYQAVSEIKRVFEDPDLIAGRYQDPRLTTEDMTGLRFVESELPKPAFMSDASTRISSAVIGTATHLVMQRIDLSQGAPSQADVTALIAQLERDQAIEPTVAKLIKVDRIVSFFAQDGLGKKLVRYADRLQREVPFSLLLDADRLYQGYTGTEKVLVHGIIDGFFTDDDGEVWLFDYKTDRLRPGQPVDALKQRYQGQLNIYAQALVAMGMPMPKRVIYSFDAAQSITF